MRTTTRNITLVFSLVGLLAGSFLFRPAEVHATSDAGAATIRPDEDLIRAWSQARALAQAAPSDLGHPWIDDSAGHLVLAAATEAGESKARAWLTRGARVSIGVRSFDIPAPLVSTVVRTVSRSYTALEHIMDDATTLVEKGMIDADAIMRTEVDPSTNQVIITVDRASSRLQSALASRYGSAVVVRVGSPGDRPQLASRNIDFSPFKGGAKLTLAGEDCTAGFSWYGSTQYMISSGHCVPNGGSASTGGDLMGQVNSGSGENWTAGVGTVYFTGQSTYRGDLSQVVMNAGKSGAARIYTGGANDEVYRSVREMWHRSPYLNDQFCTSGRMSFEVCGWQVQLLAGNVQYDNGEWVRRIYAGVRPQGSGNCVVGGDSGGPTYTIRGDGAVAAKGIISGQRSTLNTCTVYFSDIWDAYYALPGWLKVE